MIEPLGATANTCSNAGGGVIMAFESGRAGAGTYANTPQGSAECCKWCLAVAIVELKVAKMHTVSHHTNGTECDRQVDLLLSDYLLYASN